MNQQTRSFRLRALPSMVAISVLVLGACGGDDSADDPAADPATEPAESAGVTSDASSSDAPSGDASSGDATSEPATEVSAPAATVPSDVPEEYLEAIGPMDVDGDYLPVLATDDFDSDAAVGMPAPVVVGVDFDGNPVRIDAAQDGPTMVVFLAHWCPHCNAEIPVFNELRDEGRFPDGLNIVAVSTAPDPSRPNFPPSEWLDERDWTYPVVAEGVDTEISPPWLAAEAYGVNGFPFIALVDANGDVAARWSGEREPDSTIEAIEQRLGL